MNIPDSLIRAFECRCADWGGVSAMDYFLGMLDMFCELNGLDGLDAEAVYEELNDMAQARAEIQED